jgi:magnesium chelatase subunit ChlD-like protein
MLQARALAFAKGAARALAAAAARARAHVVLLSFGGAEARLEAGARGALATVDRAIGALGASGATPLRHAIQLGLRLASGAPVAGERRLVLFTDARSRDDLGGLVHAAPLLMTLVDCERAALRLGRARGLAWQLRAQYVHIDELWPSTPERAPALAGERGPRA